MARSSLRTIRGPIVLLTDFGLKEGHAGVMKGVIRGICRSAEIIDLSHGIAPQDVAEAAFVLAASYRYFPPEAIFVAVVDPGVGTERAILCLRANRQTFLAPDNGLLSAIAEESGGALRRVTAERFLKNPSATFHGRDIFAPVAAHLAAGLPVSKLGPRVERMRKLALPKPTLSANGALRGEVIYVDHFGNVVTNIQKATLARHLTVPLAEVQVRIRRRAIRGVSQTYSDGKRGELVALIGSAGYLEVAVNQGSAARSLGCAKGDAVRLAAPERRAR